MAAVMATAPAGGWIARQAMVATIASPDRERDASHRIADDQADGDGDEGGDRVPDDGGPGLGKRAVRNGEEQHRRRTERRHQVQPVDQVHGRGQEELTQQSEAYQRPEACPERLSRRCSGDNRPQRAQSAHPTSFSIWCRRRAELRIPVQSRPSFGRAGPCTRAPSDRKGAVGGVPGTSGRSAHTPGVLRAASGPSKIAALAPSFNRWRFIRSGPDRGAEPTLCPDAYPLDWRDNET